MATIKIKLGNRPKNFKRVVTFPMIDGTTGAIEVSYRYRTRKEFGAFIDELFATADGASDAKASTVDEKFSMLSTMERTGAANAEYVLKVADGWNLDEPFTAESIEQLSDEIPAAVTAIMETYRVAVTEGRSGN